MAKKSSTKKSPKRSTKTAHLRSLFKAKINRLRKSGVNVPQSVIATVETAPWATLNKYHKNNYREFHKYIDIENRVEALIDADERAYKLVTTSHKEDPLHLEERYQHLVDKGVIIPSGDVLEKEYQKSVIKYAKEAKYSELYETLRNPNHPNYERARLANKWSSNDPEAFNDWFGKDIINELPNETNTINTSDLVYNHLQALIEEAVMGANDGEAWMANKLQEMLQQEIDYAIQQCNGDRQKGFDKAMAAIDQADGWLIEQAEKFIFDSDGWKDDAWKGSLMAMATQIHGYIDDELMEQVAAMDKLREDIQEY